MKLRHKYREVVASPCRVVYRVEGRIVWVVHVRRFEQDEWPEEM